MTTNCRLREELEQARAEIAELKAAQRPRPRDLLGLYKQPIRVPFTDEQIERMAKAAHKEFGNPDWEVSVFKDAWINAIRAALAAGGLEPCPVPEYRPEDVALRWQSIEPGLDPAVDPLVDAYLRGYIEATGKRSTDISYSRTGLAYVRDAVLATVSDRLARVSAKSARRRTAIKQLQKAHDGWRKLAFKYDEHIKHLQQQAENRSKNYEELLKQRDILKIERDTFENAATKALDERDHRPTWEHLEKVKAEAEACDVARYAAEAQLDALHPGETIEGILCERDHYRVQLEREQEWVKQYKQDRDDAMAELAAVKQERDTWRVGHDLANERVAVLESELAQVKQERDAACEETRNVFIGMFDAKAELAAPTAAQVEALARVLRAKYWGEDRWDGEILKANKEDWLGVARASIAHLDKRPEGLPTLDTLAAKGYRDMQDVWNNKVSVDYLELSENGRESYRHFVSSILTALAPYLREPVGWELDAPEGGWLSEGFCIHNPSTGETHSLDSFVSHVCSRIRPVYECKECAARTEEMLRPQPEIRCAMCAEWEKDCRALSAASRSIDARIAARAALEGE